MTTYYITLQSNGGPANDYYDYTVDALNVMDAINQAKSRAAEQHPGGTLEVVGIEQQ